MATISDIQFTGHPAGAGFEGELRFENGHGIMVVCGPYVYNKEGADLEERVNAVDYTTFQYLYVNPLQGEYTNSDWVGPVGAAEVNAKIAEIEAFPPAGDADGGVGV